ncbi:sensor histidine kinase [Hymenobacter seoulensis]
MRRLLLVCLLVCCAWKARAAPEVTPATLLRQLKTQSADTGRVRLLTALCYLLHDDAPTRALIYGEESVALARQLPDQKSLLQSLLTLASCYANLADGPHALQLQQEALQLARHLQNTDGIVRSYTGMGGVHHERKDTTAALLNYKRALAQVYRPGVQVRTQLLLFGNLGSLYFYLKRHQEGLTYTRRALQLARRSGDQVGETLYMADLGSFYMRMNQLDTAEGLIRQAITLVEPLKSPRFEAGHLELLATVLVLRNKLTEAEALTHRALQLARQSNYQELALDAYNLLAEINFTRGRHEQAYKWQLRFRDLNDSLNSRSRLQTLTALQTRYETADKENQIRRLTERSFASQQRTRALWGAIAALLLGLGGMALLYAKLRRSRAALASNHQALEAATQELRQLSASKDRLYAIIAHDLRGPVTSFAGVTELIDFYLKQGDEQGLRRLPDLVRQSAYQLNHLLDNLLSWAVSQTGELAYYPEPLLAADLLKQTAELYSTSAEAKQLTIQLAADPKAAVWADAHMTQTILRNIVGNALKFTPPGGTIRLCAHPAPSGGVQFQITDTGTGMSPEQIELLLTPEAATHPARGPRSGTGLGLMLCRAFVQRQDGTMRIESTPGHGTTLSVTLPAARA